MSHHMARGCHRTGVKRGGGNRQNDFVVIDGEEGTCSIVISTNRMCALYINSSYLKKKKRNREKVKSDWRREKKKKRVNERMSVRMRKESSSSR